MPSDPNANNISSEERSTNEQLRNNEDPHNGSKAAKAAVEKPKPPENRVVRLLEKNPLGLTLPEMAGGPRQVKKIRILRPMLAEAIKNGLVMPVSQRAGNTVYRMVKFLGPR